MLRLQSPPFCLSFRWHATTKLGRITKAWANVSPSPGGDGGGEGAQDVRSLGRFRFGLGDRKPSEGPHGFEPFIIPSVRLCRGSLTIFLGIGRSFLESGTSREKVGMFPSP